MATAKTTTKNGIEKYKDNKFRFLLYPADSTHVKALEEIKLSYEYAYILHDKDVYEEDDLERGKKKGDLKDPHWHVVIRFSSGSSKRWSTALAKELGIEPNYIRECKNIDKALEYLIHYNDDDKYQYKEDEVQGPLRKRMIASMNKGDVTEDERVDRLIDFINESGYLTVTEFAKYCATNGYWDVFRRSGVIFCKILEEHNRICMSNRADEYFENEEYLKDKVE